MLVIAGLNSLLHDSQRCLKKISFALIPQHQAEKWTQIRLNEPGLPLWLLLIYSVPHSAVTWYIDKFQHLWGIHGPAPWSYKAICKNVLNFTNLRFTYIRWNPKVESNVSRFHMTQQKFLSTNLGFLTRSFLKWTTCTSFSPGKFIVIS